MDRKGFLKSFLGLAIIPFVPKIIESKPALKINQIKPIEPMPVSSSVVEFIKEQQELLNKLHSKQIKFYSGDKWEIKK